MSATRTRARRRVPWIVLCALVSASAVQFVIAGAQAAPARIGTPARTTRASAPVIAAAGDISCDPMSPDYNGGLGTAKGCQQLATSDLLTGGGLAGVLALGDTQYWCGGLDAFNQAYDPTWGRVLPITYPVPGNHEYRKAANTTGTNCAATHRAPGYFKYFGAQAQPSGESWYSFNIGTWHLIALNAECHYIGGCGAGSAQEIWLQQDLAANPSTCTLAFWHQPRFTSSKVGNDAHYAAFWDDLYAAGADVVLNGHVHNYERFAPQTPSQIADPNGLTEFIVGTGGVASQPFSTTIEPNSLVRKRNLFGVLELTLGNGSYSWRFVSANPTSFTDTGSATCH